MRLGCVNLLNLFFKDIYYIKITASTGRLKAIFKIIKASRQVYVAEMI